jgi:hypothetical protein
MSKGNNLGPIEKWFDSAEEIDEFIGIRFGYLAPGAVEPQWTFLPHKRVDGIGGFAELLRQRGATLDQLPQITDPRAPSLRSLLPFWLRSLAPRQRLAWDRLPIHGENAPVRRDISPPAVAWHVFDEHTTACIRRVCRQGQVTVNSFLMFHLARAMRPFFKQNKEALPWMVPVNMRGAVHRHSDTANYSSYVAIRVAPGHRMLDVHQAIHTALFNGEHWSNWYALFLGKVLPNSVRKWLLRHDRATSQWNIGSFSNLGNWDPEMRFDSASLRGSWLFSPPVLRQQNVGAGCVTFQGKLSLTIQSHPELTTNAEVPRRWLRAWLAEVEADLAMRTAEIHRLQISDAA